MLSDSAAAVESFTGTIRSLVLGNGAVRLRAAAAGESACFFGHILECYNNKADSLVV
jgi:hypothetical protein